MFLNLILAFVILVYLAFSVEFVRNPNVFVNLIFTVILFGIYGYFTSYITIALNFIATNPLFFIICFFAYFAIGGLYVLLWRYKAYLVDHIEQIKLTRRNNKNSDVSYSPYKMKSRIINWIIWWPFSLIYHLSYRPIEFVSSFVYKIIFGNLNKIYIKYIEDNVDES